jgi:predicted ABC-class ATPase
VTLVVGGGFHGKSTLLRALERGVQNHCPGDGRERVVTVVGAVKVRAEDGRSVGGVDISAFIDGLPFGEDTTAFSTPQASGSTSQAAAVMEALEAGATALLVDEDTAATNFMIRDRRMQALVARSAEPITPFLDRVRDLLDVHGVSTVLVVGGSGDYVDVADTVISMRDYAPFDVTEQARDVAASHPTGRARDVGHPFGSRPARIPLPASVNPRRGKREVSVGARGPSRILFGTEEIDLSAVEPEVSPAQARAIALALAFARAHFMDGERALPEILDQVDARIERDGLDALDPRRGGDLAGFRRFELAAALNRLRTLRVKGPSHG